jgi:hypothetical protein
MRKFGKQDRFSLIGIGSVYECITKSREPHNAEQAHNRVQCDLLLV